MALVEGSLQETNLGKITYGDFKNFTVDLGILEKKKQRRVKPKELYSTTLLFPPKTIDDYTKKKYLSEFHRRNLISVWSLISIFIALVGLFSGSMTGRKKGKNLLVTSILFIGAQAFLLTAINLLKKTVELAPAMYGVHLLFLFAGFAYIVITKKNKKK